MPQIIPLAISAIGTAIGASTALTAIASLAATVVIGSYEQRRAKKKARDQFNASQVDRMSNVVTTVAPRELVLGRVRKGGPVSFRGSTGSMNELFMFHMPLAAHEIDGVEQVYLNDVAVTLDADGWVQTAPYYQERKVSHRTTLSPFPAGTVMALPHTPIPGTVSLYYGQTTDASEIVNVAVSVTDNVLTLVDELPEYGNLTYQYIAGDSYARVRWDLGAGTAVADERTTAIFGSTLWSADHRGQGVAKIICEFNYNETAFPSGLPVVSALIRGAKVYDPRTGLTAFSENPALLARHVYQHPYFGKATVSSDEDARFAAAANACDIEQHYVVDGETSTRALYTAALVAPYGATAASVLDDLTQSMAGMWAFAGGELHIRAGVYTAPVMTLTDADLAVVQRQGDSESQESMSIAVHRERAEKFNVVNLRIWDSGQDYKMAALAPVKAAALIARDGEELAQEVQMPAVFYAPQAQHIAGVMMRDARDPLVFEAPWKMRAYPLELFDTVNVTLARYGWTDKTMMVVNRVWDHERGIVKLALKETSAAIYTPDAEFLAQGYAENTAIPRPWDIDPPTLTASGIFSGTDELVALSDGTVLTRVRVTWLALADQTISSGGHIEVQWAPVDSDKWQSVTVDGSASEAYILGAQDGSAIVIRARSKNAVAVSDWCEQVVHVVVGKTEPPPQVDRFTVIEQAGGIKQFFWQIAYVPPDLDSFVVRYSLGTTQRPWDEMITLFAKGRNAREHETTEPRQDDTYTFAICAVDTSGNRSDPVYVTETLDGDAFGAVSLLVLPYEQGWPGTKTNCYVSGAILVPGSGTWGDINVSWGSLSATSWADVIGAGAVDTIVYEHQVVDTGSSVARTIRASSLASGTATIEYASSDDGSTYAAWAAIPSSPVTARYFKFRWTVNSASPILYRAQVVFYG